VSSNAGSGTKSEPGGLLNSQAIAPDTAGAAIDVHSHSVIGILGWHQSARSGVARTIEDDGSRAGINR